MGDIPYITRLCLKETSACVDFVDVIIMVDTPGLS